MPIPHLPQMRIALWEQLEKSGSHSKAQDVIESLAEHFQITSTEREQRDKSGNKTFDHRVHSAVAQSRKVGWLELVEDGGYGYWTLTNEYYSDNPQHMIEEYRIGTHIIEYKGEPPDYTNQESLTKLTEAINKGMNELMDGTKAKWPDKNAQIISHSFCSMGDLFVLTLLFHLTPIK
jgi:restriction endonuclease Mrr